MMFGCPMWVWVTVGILLIVLLIVVIVKVLKRSGILNAET
jgi:heme exporter protein D